MNVGATNSPAGQAAPNRPKSTNRVPDPMIKYALFTLSPAAALADYRITAMRGRRRYFSDRNHAYALIYPTHIRRHNFPARKYVARSSAFCANDKKKREREREREREGEGMERRDAHASRRRGRISDAFRNYRSAATVLPVVEGELFDRVATRLSANCPQLRETEAWN